MELLRDSGLEAGVTTTLLRPPLPTLTVVVKATFALDDHGRLTLADAQSPVRGDGYEDDDPGRALVYESDLAVVKPCGEVIVQGSFYAPRGAPITTSAVSFELGAVRRSAAVFGPRRWVGRLVAELSEPERVVTVPLTWASAFGGAVFVDNPLGRGADGAELPLVEDPNGLLQSPSARANPVCFGPIPRTWPVRVSRAGTFGADYARTTWPWLPADHDPHYHLATHPLQWCNGYWRGDEAFALQNLRPAAPLVRGVLPGFTARGMLQRTDGRAPEALRFVLDTVRFDTDAATVTLLWRATSSTVDAGLSDVAWIFLSHDAPGTSALPLMARYEALRAQQAAEQAAFLPEPIPEEPPPQEAPPAPAAPPVNEADEAEKALASVMALAAAQPPEPEVPSDPQALKEACKAAGVPWQEPPVAPDEEIESVLDDKERVLAALARGEALDGWDLTETDLSGIDLSRAHCHGTIFTRANLTSTLLKGADLTGANFSEATLVGADLSEAKLVHADFTRAVLDDAVLVRVLAQSVCLEAASMARSLATSSDFRKAVMIEMSAPGARFDEAVLDGADLSKAVLDGAVFFKASLTKATLEGARLAQCDLRDATLERVRASLGAVFLGADLRGARAPFAIFGHADFRGASLAFAEAPRADFSNANLAGAVLDGCDLKKARFSEAVMEGALVRQADAMEANFEGASLVSADLRGANCYAANFYRARLDGAALDLALLGGTLLEVR